MVALHLGKVKHRGPSAPWWHRASPTQEQLPAATHPSPSASLTPESGLLGLVTGTSWTSRTPYPSGRFGDTRKTWVPAHPGFNLFPISLPNSLPCRVCVPRSKSRTNSLTHTVPSSHCSDRSSPFCKPLY